MTLLLVRHTQPDIAPGICYGRLDVELAPSQRTDIECALKKLPLVSAIYSSPSRRCALLAEALAHRDQVAVTLDDRLRELDFGIWEGCPWDQISIAEIDHWSKDLWSVAPGQGENLQALWARITSFRLSLPHSDQTIAIVSHLGPLRAFSCQLRGSDWSTLFDQSLAYGESWQLPLHAGPNTGKDVPHE